MNNVASIPDRVPRKMPGSYGYVLILGLFLLLMWDWSGFDTPVAQWFFDPRTQTFPLRNHWLLTTVLHTTARNTLWCFVLFVLFAASAPQAWRQRMPLLGGKPRRVSAVLLLLLLLTPAIIPILKSQSLPFCPWDEQGFGGSAPHYEWWQVWTQTITGKFGRCWPAGHASGGFGLLGVYFWACAVYPRHTTQCLGFALVVGFAMGLAQQVRGAHFMSHTLWTAWFAWAMCGGAAIVLRKHLQFSYEAKRTAH